MFETIRDMILEYIDVKKESITPDTKFIQDLEMSSLDIMTMIGELEEKLDIEIPVEDLSDIFTIQDLINYLDKKTK